MDADSKKQKARNEHPLNNFLVLKEVLKYDTSPQTILRNRLVSPTWLEACTGYWLKLSKYPVLRYTALPEEGNGCDGRVVKKRTILMSLSEFYELYQAQDPVVMRMVTKMDHSKMELYAWQFSEESSVPENVSPNVDRWFWKWAATPWLTTLTLVDCEFQREAWVFKERFLRMLPGLMNLTVRECVVHPEALRDINQAHQSWMEYGNRKEWIRQRRSLVKSRYLYPPETFFLPNRFNNLPYFENGYQHGLLNLDVSLKVAVAGEENGEFALKSTTPLRIWGPLLAMLPKLKKLSIGDYHEDTEEPPPTLKPPGWDNDICKGFKGIIEDLSYGLREGETTEGLETVKRRRGNWLGTYNEEPQAPAPRHLGNFWELIWDEVIGQVELSLVSLNLLDFSARAQLYGVLSTCEAAAEDKDLFGKGNVYDFPRMTDLALDLGLDPDFVERDLLVIRRWMKNVFRLKLYRAPFDDFERSIDFLRFEKVKELELWGNLSPNLDFLINSFPNVRKLCWVTSCYEKAYHGKRIHHLLKEGRKAFPLFTEDLINMTNWSRDSLSNLRHLEMDWGPIPMQSWKQLGILDLTDLKAVVYGDEQLEEIAKIWPRLESLEMAHRSCVTATCLGEVLAKLWKLRSFKWNGCACTNDFFQVADNMEILQGIGIKVRKRFGTEATMEFPWEIINHDKNGVCMQAEFENALISGDSSTFFSIMSS